MPKTKLPKNSWRRVALAVAAIATLAAAGGLISSKAYQSYKEHRFIEKRLKPLLSDLDGFIVEYEKFLEYTDPSKIVDESSDPDPKLVEAIRAWQVHEEKARSGYADRTPGGDSQDPEKKMMSSVEKYNRRIEYVRRLQAEWPAYKKRLEEIPVKFKAAAKEAPTAAASAPTYGMADRIMKNNWDVFDYVDERIGANSPSARPNDYGGYIPSSVCTGLEYTHYDGLNVLKLIRRDFESAIARMESDPNIEYTISAEPV